MKIKHTFTLFCVTLTLALFLVSCADTQGNGDGGETEYTGPFEASNVSDQQCTSSLSTLSCFISVWNTENTGNGASATNEVKLPLVSGGTYDLYVNWGDGKEVEKITTASAATHEYATPGEYTVHIAGTIKGWRFFAANGNYGDAVKLTDVSQWGSLSLGNTAGGQFYGAQNFNPTATDAPDVSETTDLSTAFYGASNFNGEIGNWDVSTVTDMSYMFSGASSFNNNGKPLDWGDKTSNVTDMRLMFKFASAFNQDINDWDVSQVTEMGHMFNDASNFNNGGKALNWKDNTSSVVAMTSMFAGATNFNQDISGWNVANVTKMNSMFNDASNFNNGGKPLDWGNKTSKVIDMTEMFQNAGVFNQEIRNWNVANVTTMAAMFANATNFNQDISDWEVSKVTSMTYMFWSASSFNNNGKPLDWGNKTSKVTDMSFMFNLASAFNQDISEWDVGNVPIDGNFATDSGLELNNIPFKFREIDTISKAICDANPLTNCFISVWNTENSGGGASDSKMVKLPLVSGGTYDFYVDWGDESDVQKIEAYNADKITHTYNGGGKKTIHIAGTIKGWRFYLENDNYGDAVKLLNVTQWGSLSLGNTDGRQFRGAENFNPTATDAPDVSETTSLHSAFYGASNFNADISDWDVSKITSMAYMFNLATSFNNNGKPLDWGNKTSKVTKMQWMFWSAGVFNQDISAWDVGEVTSMYGMFGRATNFNQDISDWDVSKVTLMNEMFSGASSFNNKAAALEWGEKTSAVTGMFMMFFNASAFNQDVSKWNVAKVTEDANFAKGSGIENNSEFLPKFK